MIMRNLTAAFLSTVAALGLIMLFTAKQPTSKHPIPFIVAQDENTGCFVLQQLPSTKAIALDCPTRTE